MFESESDSNVSLEVFFDSSKIYIFKVLTFFVVAALLYYFGPPIREFIEKRLGLMFAVFCVLLVGGFILLKVIA